MLFIIWEAVVIIYTGIFCFKKGPRLKNVPVFEKFFTCCIKQSCPSTALHSQSGTVYLQRLSPLPHPLFEECRPLLSHLPQSCRLQYVHSTFIHVFAEDDFTSCIMLIPFCFCLCFSYWNCIRRVWRLEPCVVWGSPRWNVCTRGEEEPVWYQWDVSLCLKVPYGA